MQDLVAITVHIISHFSEVTHLACESPFAGPACRPSHLKVYFICALE